ncbi:complex III assembly factor LYRM7 [Episyrphus balteatus]|uniref:complex III assembly factor LYRM7 n=1 Tax=Episyrphus balteatus TaxID=286459 RepID=UPI002486AE2C|nr:complex III assembly factor LYRM7 [Episyrphus balteatus]
MSQQIRREVLKAFKKLHRTREYVFKGDQHALTAARAEINTNFRKNQTVTDEIEIKKLVKLADDVDKELRTNVVQAVEKESGVYEVSIREEVPRLENVPFNPDAIIIEKPRRGPSKCGGGESQASKT